MLFKTFVTFIHLSEVCLTWLYDHLDQKQTNYSNEAEESADFDINNVQMFERHEILWKKTFSKGSI